MGRIKKTADNPPQVLVRKVIELSEADTWDEAKKEWEFKNYYNNNSKRVRCLGCSPGKVINITVLENTLNFNELILSNSCADLYFDIDTGIKIESSRRRITKNPKNHSMNQESLDYLQENNIIHPRKNEYYKEAGSQRRKEACVVYRKEINKRFLIFTDYNNKDVFDKFYAIFHAVKENSRIHLESVQNIWDFFLRRGRVDLTLLEDIIDIFKINIDEYKNREKLPPGESIIQQWNFHQTKGIEPSRYRIKLKNKAKAVDSNALKKETDDKDKEYNFISNEMLGADLESEPNYADISYEEDDDEDLQEAIAKWKTDRSSKNIKNEIQTRPILDSMLGADLESEVDSDRIANPIGSRLFDRFVKKEESHTNIDIETDKFTTSKVEGIDNRSISYILEGSETFENLSDFVKKWIESNKQKKNEEKEIDKKILKSILHGEFTLDNLSSFIKTWAESITYISCYGGLTEFFDHIEIIRILFRCPEFDESDKFHDLLGFLSVGCLKDMLNKLCNERPSDIRNKMKELEEIFDYEDYRIKYDYKGSFIFIERVEEIDDYGIW